MPVLGICYGQQTMVAQLGGTVEAGNSREFGRADVTIVSSSPLFGDEWQKDSVKSVWMSHGDHVSDLPDGFSVIASSPGAPFAVIANEDRRYYGVQFHPEVVHTDGGVDLLRNFARNICHLDATWSMAAYREQAVAAIREQVGPEGRVICGLSGGVDSSVAAILIHEAIGERLTCVFVDTGLLRKGEADEVVNLFGRHYNIPLIHADASEMFLSRLEGVSDPEQKRKIIGKRLYRSF